ncbi:MAG: hypothetical protein OHK0029_30500 [Armatimonadaceae bacterium]
MLFPWRNRQTLPDDEEDAGLREIAPLPAAPDAGFTICPYSWNTVLGATILGYSNILTQLLLSGSSPNQEDTHGRTALMYAVALDRRPVVQMLLNAEADVNRRDHFGHSPLLIAYFRNRQWCVDKLAASGACTGFAEAIAAGNVLAAHSDPVNTLLDAPVLNGRTLLTYTAFRGRFAETELLLRRGANPTTLDGLGYTPLDAAMEASRGRIVRLLVDYGADPTKTRDDDPGTVLKWAGFEEDSARLET